MKEILKGLFKIKNKIHLGSLFLISVLCLLPSFSESFFTSSSTDSENFSATAIVQKTLTEFTCFHNSASTMVIFDSSNAILFFLYKNDIGCVSPGTYTFRNYGGVATNVFFTNKSQFGSDLSSYFGGSGGSCDYSGYVAEEDITQNYCTNKFDTLITQTNCNNQYAGYITQTNCDSQYAGYILESSVNQNYCVNNNLCPSSSCDYSGYILESSVNQSYCENHGLCPTCPICPSGSGEVSWSSLYINDIQHLGGPNINITIPQEISRDYEYDSNDDFNLDVEGYNVDYDYMDSIVSTQTYTPDSEDFTTIITDVIPKFVPGLVIILFIYFIFRFIKKIF